MRTTGWVLDVYVEDGGAVTWLRDVDCYHLKLTDEYNPSIYVLPKEGHANEVLRALGSDIGRVLMEEKRVNLSGERRKVIRVSLKGLKGYRRILRTLEAMPQIQDIYNTDLLHIQQYLFTQLDVAPTSKVEVEYEGHRLKSIRPLDDTLEIAPPPFTSLSFSIDVRAPFLTPRVERDPIASITACFSGEEYELRGSEDEV